MELSSVLVFYSYHHNNTEKIAKSIAKVLDADIKKPQEVNPGDLHKYNLIGFGSGMYDGKHHKSFFALVDKLPQVTEKKAFIFSTCGIPGIFAKSGEETSIQQHLMLRGKLKSKGYKIVGEFGCPGFNTNSFLKWFGGINRGRPNAQDLKSAEMFAIKLKQESQ
ncbi:MAG: flavodoxin family protein [Actinomycetota bacterium]